MNNRNSINDELDGLQSSLPSQPNGHPYSVPEGYFEGLAGAVLNRVKTEGQTAAVEIAGLSPLLAGIPRTMPFSLPEGYFEQNLDSLSAVTAGEEESLVLSFIEKDMPNSIPSTYFEELPFQLLERVRPAKTVPVMRRKWMHLVAAALITGIVTLSGIFYFQGPSGSQPAPLAQELKKASTPELDAFITDVTVSNEPATKNAAEVKQLLQDVSDNDLEAFLDQVPTGDDELMLN
jgi:hypothetical protein